MEYTC